MNNETLTAAEVETLVRELDKVIAANPSATPIDLMVWETGFRAHLLAWRGAE